MIDRIVYDNREYAIVIRADYHEEGIQFLTDDSYSQQLAYMHHPNGKIIEAHVHNREVRNVEYTQEVLVIRKGVLRVDFYRNDYSYIESLFLHEGDVILLVSGGHGFEVIEEVEMIEIKQGPYLGENDKKRFKHVDSSKVVIRSSND